MNEQEPKSTIHEIMTPGQLVATGTFLVIPCYILLAWLVHSILGDQALLSPSSRLGWFGALSGCSLAGILVSRWLATRNRRKRAGFLWALCCTEFPSTCGLVYFILFRDATGFAMLLLLSFCAFFYLASSLPRPEQT